MSKEIQPTGENAIFVAELDKELLNELQDIDVKFENIKIAKNGRFQVPGESEPEYVDEFSAVILHSQKINAYYPDAYSGGHEPPQCASKDGINGAGDPGGLCQNCPFDEWGITNCLCYTSIMKKD